MLNIKLNHIMYKKMFEYKGRLNRQSQPKLAPVK